MTQTSQSVTDQRLKMAFNRIQELKNNKLDFKDYVKFEQKAEVGLKDARFRFEQIEASLRNTIDYMLRYQWKETRNIVNRALAKVAKPLELKELFFTNVVDASPELWYEQQIIQSLKSEESKTLDAVPVDTFIITTDDLADSTKQLEVIEAADGAASAPGATPAAKMSQESTPPSTAKGDEKADVVEPEDQKSLDTGPQLIAQPDVIIQEVTESKSNESTIHQAQLIDIQSPATTKQSKLAEIMNSNGSTFKVPNLLITDYKFEPTDKDNDEVHPILGTKEVRNVHDLDWDSLRNIALQEWSEVC